MLYWVGKKIPDNYRLLVAQALRPFVAKDLVICQNFKDNLLLTAQDQSVIELNFVRKLSGIDGICTTGSFHEQQGLVLALALVAVANILPIDIATESGAVIEDKSLRQVPKELLGPLFTQDKIEQLLEELGFLVNFKSAVKSNEVSLFF